MKIFRYFLIGAICLYFIIGFGSFLVKFFSEPKTECGVITYKATQNVTHKYSSHIEFILVVQFQSGKRDINTTASTWSSYSEGDRICFETDKHYTFSEFFGAVTCSVCILMIGLPALIYFLITGENFYDDLV